MITSETGSTPDLIDRFCSYLESTGKSAITVKNYRSDIKGFIAWIENLGSSGEKPAVSESAVAEFRSALMRDFRPATVNRKVSVVKGFTRWWASLPSAESLAPSPFLVRVKSIVREKSPVWLDTAAQIRLLSQAETSGSPQLNAILTLLLHTGLRVSELLDLHWNDVHINRRRSELWVASKAGGRRIPLDLEAQRALRILGYQEKTRNPGKVLDSKFTRRVIERCIERFSRQADLARLSLHALRHTYIRNILAAGMPKEAVAELTGIRRLDLLDVYSWTGEMPIQKAALRRAKGACEVCGARRNYPDFLSVVKVSREGHQTEKWMVLCPNCNMDKIHSLIRKEFRTRHA